MGVMSKKKIKKLPKDVSKDVESSKEKGLEELHPNKKLKKAVSTSSQEGENKKDESNKKLTKAPKEAGKHDISQKTALKEVKPTAPIQMKKVTRTNSQEEVKRDE